MVEADAWNGLKYHCLARTSLPVIKTIFTILSSSTTRNSFFLSIPNHFHTISEYLKQSQIFSHFFLSLWLPWYFLEPLYCQLAALISRTDITDFGTEPLWNPKEASGFCSYCIADEISAQIVYCPVAQLVNPLVLPFVTPLMHHPLPIGFCSVNCGIYWPFMPTRVARLNF